MVDDEAATAPAGTTLPTFEEVYARHCGYVAGLAGRILGRNDDVPDVVQEVFLIAHRRLSRVQHPDAVRTWLGRITVREASRRLRWRRVRALFWPKYPTDADLVADEAVGPELLPMIALLYATLDRVPAHARTAWVLRHLLEEPLDTVAEVCGCSIATAKRRIASADGILAPLLRRDEEDAT